MTNAPKKIQSLSQSNQERRNYQGGDRQSQSDTTQKILDTISGLSGGLQGYSIRELVQHAQEFGPELRNQRLETNQVRKFLDAINQIKARLPQIEEEVNRLELSDEEKAKLRFTKIETDVVLLKPKLAYAAARQDAVRSLYRVMAEAIDKVRSEEDFDRLVQFMEAIIAYHKAAGGK